ncbi:Disulfide bond formation protein DsbB [Shimia gijangensis]|uniref:Disulfide bond formation protein DsbB n=1 Tax=Shimia gijangensis TaxID=1470563 RepID=A0A1M6HK30_9RHOB|nr:disulfide bond formation protein B [Shimia gijangensis]SHJ22560.1 Disulfide bond formation protein DsbB [Shimia gijangensis]
MTLSRRFITLCLTGFSVASILGAWGFQYIGGMAPCAMCYWQRWPHWAAIGLGILALALGARLWYYFAALAALTTSMIGFYHSGVERKWWLGPSSCTGRGLSSDSGNLLSMDGPSLAMCDEIPWQMLGVTMANLNAIGSLVIAGLWIWAAHLPKEGRKFF